ncbi:MAG: hypothetical protein OXF75_07725 [Acidimicrobiaceae bacterium]|nr:hypothetical protein [Acidimicrobiaceae bacterium]
MDWAETCLDHLIGGGALNLVGLDGSGRSRGLHMIAAALDPRDWASKFWSPGDLAKMKRREIHAAIEILAQSSRIPVLLIDDFGEFLMAGNGPWLERLLFSKVFGMATGDYPSLRCVVVTHPRDREIGGPSSGLRERARHMHPPEWTPTAQEIARFGCTDAEDLLLFTGYNSKLLGVSGHSPDARRGVVRSTARKMLPSWVGQLDAGHQKRLGAILSRKEPPRWRHDDADPSLTPLIVPNRSHRPARCAITDCMRLDEIRQLLVGQPWPDRDLRAASRRFYARCGSDPAPLWVDNFLSDTSQLNYSKLVEFLQMVLSDLSEAASIRLLSRNWIGGHSVYAADIVTVFREAGSSPELEARLHWRLYDQRNCGNLHGRELILGTRRTTFRLPPAEILIGEVAAGNETDAEVAFSSSASTFAAWKSGTTVIRGDRSSS